MKLFWDGVFRKNPVLVLSMGLVPAVAMATTGLNGLIIGISIAVMLLVSSMINFVLVPLMPENIRLVLRALILIVLVMIIFGFFIHAKPGLIAGLGIFFPFMVADAFRLQNTDIKGSLSELILEALGQGVGFTWVLILIGVIREFLAFGAIFGREIVATALRPMSLAKGVPGGLIIVGLLLAFANIFYKRGGELCD